jgi:DNA-binding MarR family transcriptional regulator
MTSAERVRLLATKTRNVTSDRDQAIALMQSEGASLRAIGEAAGMSHTAIRKIVARLEKGAAVASSGMPRNQSRCSP